MSTSLRRIPRVAAQYELYHLRRCTPIHQKCRAYDDLQSTHPRSPLLPRTSTHPFSTSRSWREDAPKTAPKKTGSMNYKLQKAKEQAMREGQMPEDVGLLPGTFVMPRGKKLPSWISNFKDRLSLERLRAFTKGQEFFALLINRHFNIKPKPALNRAEARKVAVDLHQKVYENFALGTLDPIQSYALPGFIASLRGRLAQRPGGTQLKWFLHEHKKKAKLVSYKIGLIPGAKDETKFERKGVIQAVVRIHSLQSLLHVRRGKNTRETLLDAQGRRIWWTEQEARKQAKEVVEYVVMQKPLKNSREGQWKLWGTTEETTVPKLEHAQRKTRKGQKDPDLLPQA